MSRNRRLALLSAFAVLLVARAVADLDGSYVLPLDDWAIQYATRPLADPVTLLQQRIKRGEAKLDYDPDYGYLPSVLRNLQAPVSSQVLVFSKTSFQARAYLSSNAQSALLQRSGFGGLGEGRRCGRNRVGRSAPGSNFLYARRGEVGLAANCAPGSVPAVPCVGQHAGCAGNGGRSVYPDASGMPLFHVGTFITDHRSPLKQRWGGYYVTGTHGAQSHMGNMIYEDAEDTAARYGPGNQPHRSQGTLRYRTVSQSGQRHRGADDSGAPVPNAEFDHARGIRNAHGA